MTSRINHIYRIVSAICIEILRPRVIGIPGIAILRDKSARSGIIESRIHIVEPCGGVRYAACEGNFVEEADVAAVLLESAELVVGVALLQVQRQTNIPMLVCT